MTEWDWYLWNELRKLRLKAEDTQKGCGKKNG